MANYVHGCATAHQFVETFARFGRMVCCAVKIESGEFDRELIREKWGRDPVQAIESDMERGLMGVEYDVVERLWILVSEGA